MTKYISLAVAAAVGVYLIASAHAAPQRKQPDQLVTQGQSAEDQYSLYNSLDKQAQYAYGEYLKALILGPYAYVSDLQDECLIPYKGNPNQLLACWYSQALYLSVDKTFKFAGSSYKAYLESHRQLFLQAMFRTDYSKYVRAKLNTQCTQGDNLSCSGLANILTQNYQ